MALSQPIGRRTRARRESWVESSPYVAAVLAAAVTLALTLTVPPALVLPGLSVALVAVALGLAAATRRAPPGVAVPSRYVSAALAFLGFGAALLTDPEHVLPLLESPRRTP